MNGMAFPAGTLWRRTLTLGALRAAGTVMRTIACRDGPKEEPLIQTHLISAFRLIFLNCLVDLDAQVSLNLMCTEG